MKLVGRLVGIMIFLIAALQAETGQGSGFGDILDSAKKIVGSGGGGGLGTTEVVNGLKEALEIGTGYAVDTASKPDGYYSNPSIKIPLPGAVQKVEKLLRAVGYGQKVDEFELSMNRAAEKAAPQAKSIFMDAVKQMQFDDAQKILKGPDNAATEYFKEKTSGRLTEVFKPIVKDSMSSVGATRQYEDLNSKLSSIPMGGKLGFDLDQYVTDKSLKGLFYLVAVEEKKIRQDPAARTTELLKKVFGSR
jgi:hypothetical protein